MSLHSPHSSQTRFSISASTPPPPPPPKGDAHSSGAGTPSAGPPRPPPPPNQTGYDGSSMSGAYTQDASNMNQRASGIAPPQEGWLPDVVKDKNTADLQALLSDPSLQNALTHSIDTAHPSLPASNNHLQSLLTENVALSQSLSRLEQQLIQARSQTQSRLLSLRALEAQWRAKQAEQDDALKSFSPPALYQSLSAAVVEQEALCRGLEESFLEGRNHTTENGMATEREVMEYTRKLREAWELAYLRRERKERWDEGRVGGWR